MQLKKEKKSSLTTQNNNESNTSISVGAIKEGEEKSSLTTQNNNESNSSISVGAIKEGEEKSSLTTQNNLANNIKIRPAVVSETSNSNEIVKTKKQNLTTKSATSPIISSNPIQKRQIALNQGGQGTNSLIMSTVSASTLRKDEIVGDNYIINEKTTNLNSNLLTANQLNSITSDSNSLKSINTFQESQNTLPISRREYKFKQFR